MFESLAVHIGAMLHPFVVSLLPKYSLRMGYLHNSNTERSGKTLQCKMATMPAMGKPMAVQAWARKDEDLKKILDAEALRADIVIRKKAEMTIEVRPSECGARVFTKS